MKPLKKKVSITLDGDLIDEIRKRADDRSFSQYINIVLKEYLLKEQRPESSQLYV